MSENYFLVNDVSNDVYRLASGYSFWSYMATAGTNDDGSERVIEVYQSYWIDPKYTNRSRAVSKLKAQIKSTAHGFKEWT